MAYLDNFPQKFSPREIQKDLINDVESAIKSDYKNILICAPTGIGKSHVAVTVAKSLESSFLITAQKILQDQYTRDFTFLNSLKGKPNFPCIDLYDTRTIKYEDAMKDSRLLCDKGNCSRVEMVKGKSKTVFCEHKPKLADYTTDNKGTELEIVHGPTGQCYYYDQKYKALNSSHVTFNYASYFQTKRFSTGIESLLARNCIIADEAHEIEDQIIGFIGHDILLRHLQDLGYVFSDFDTKDIDGVATMVDRLAEENQREINKLEVRNPDDKRITMFKNRRDKLTSVLRELIKDTENFIFQIINDSNSEPYMISLKPIEVGSYMAEYFDAPHQLFMSATINKQMFCRTMGIKESDCELIEIAKSPFPPENRQVKFLNTRRLSMRSTINDYAAVYDVVDKILQKHADEKGLILTTTKKHCMDLSNHISNSRLVIAHTDAEESRENVLKNHILTTSPDVLVSPSFWYGVDLKDDQSRFQIILKTPYPSFADKRTRTKADRDPLWYQYATLVKLLQGFGRSIRNQNDHAITYVIDATSVNLIQKMQKFVPQSYHDILDME